MENRRATWGTCIAVGWALVATMFVWIDLGYRAAVKANPRLGPVDTASFEHALDVLQRSSWNSDRLSAQAVLADRLKQAVERLRHPATVGEAYHAEAILNQLRELLR